DGSRALSVRGRHRKTVHPCVGPNRASIPPAASAQESDSRSNVSLATQFFQRPVRRTLDFSGRGERALTRIPLGFHPFAPPTNATFGLSVARCKTLPFFLLKLS